MSWDFEVNGGVNCLSELEPSLHVAFSGNARALEHPVEYVGTTVGAAINQLNVRWPARYVPMQPKFDARQHVEVHVQLPLDGGYLQTIEDARQRQNAGDLILSVALAPSYRDRSATPG